MLIKQIYDEIVVCLRNHNKDNISFEAKQIVNSVLKTKDTDLIKNTREVTTEEENIIKNACQKRCEDYPLQYIIGEWEFFGDTYKVGEGVLIPRQDTETLCEVLIDDYIKEDGMKIIDLCSGSGCIAITLEKHARHKPYVFALEKSPEAIKYLKENIALNNSDVVFIEDDVLATTKVSSESTFDIVVSNPPYLNAEDMENLQEEVKHEPEMALYAEHNGYYFYEEITKLWADKIKPGGVLAYEIGIHQEERVKEILLKNGFNNVTTYKDLCGIIRVVVGTKVNIQQ